MRSALGQDTVPILVKQTSAVKCQDVSAVTPPFCTVLPGPLAPAIHVLQVMARYTPG